MDTNSKLNKLIEAVVIAGGSDLHISSGRVPSMRVAGALTAIVNQEPLTQTEIFGMIKEMVVDENKIANFLENQELDFAYDFRDGARLRGNAFFQKGEISVAMRLIPQVKTFRELNLPEVLSQFAYKKQGFFLIVGPVGQGKSTTMAAIVDTINKERSEHIITIEEPIEYIFESKKSIIDQREVGIDTKSFESALKSAFREDANVLMVGEMRSPETISAAVTAAETGHFVISTLHTNNASQTIDRIIDTFPGAQQDQIRNQLANSLIGIFSQRLIPRSSGGLVPAYELLINTKASANLIREGRTNEIDIVIETGSEHGMIDMNRSLVELVRKGEISVDDARRFSLNPKAFDNLL
ncbi:MAG: twitching motility protein PilT [Patescibacteria group bacterium]|nr:twitching motility protein PilT [Patescibacteria group bacterium]